MNSIVDSIHSSASETQEKLLRDAQRIIEGASSEDADLVRKMSELGFSKAKNVVELTPKAVKKAKKLKETIEMYKLKVPYHKFMTEEAVVELCKKYDLVRGELSDYVDRIPRKNMLEIANFKIDESLLGTVDTVYQTQWNGNDIADMDLNHLVNAIKYIQRLGTLKKEKTQELLDLIECVSDMLHRIWVVTKEDPTVLAANFVGAKVIETSTEIKMILDACYIKDGVLDAHLVPVPHTVTVDPRWLNFKRKNSSDGVSMYLLSKFLNVSEREALRIITNISDTSDTILKKSIGTSCADIIKILRDEGRDRYEDLSGEMIVSEGVRHFMERTQDRQGIQKMALRIIAGVNHFDMEGKTINIDNRCIEPMKRDVPAPVMPPVPDPIVQVKVKGGWINITAWGDEAETEEVFNPEMN